MIVWTRCLMQRPIPGLQRQFFRSALILKSNKPKFDEAELLSPQINSAPYKAKKLGNSYEWPDRSEEQLKKENDERLEKLMKLSAVVQGLLFVVGIGIAGTVYSKWPQIKGWWLSVDRRVDDDTIERLSRKKAKKSMAEIPLIPASELGPDTPGLYYWGGNGTPTRKDKPGIIFPKRNQLFDNKRLKDVCLITIDGVEKNLAIDYDGNLLQWNEQSCEVILPDQRLIKVKESNGCAYALNKYGEILIVPLKNDELRLKYMHRKRSWFLPWRQYYKYGWKLDTEHCFNDKHEKKVAQFDTGKEHLVLVSNTGKAYTCSTGLEHSNNSKSYGQFGVPNLSQFDKFPACNELYEIELLNSSLSDNNEVNKRIIEQVACGNYHTLARDSLGSIFVFGLNQYGQLGLPISYDTEQIPFPKILNRFNSYFKRDVHLKCVDVNCCGETSYVAMQAIQIDEHIRDKIAPVESISYFSFGNGQHGELGNGTFKNSQSEPSLIKIINYNDLAHKIEEWSCGGKHVICKMNNGDIVAWGCNDNGQLGSGKRIKQCKPQFIPKLFLPGVKNSQEAVFSSKLSLESGQVVAAGENSSCIYWQ